MAEYKTLKEFLAGHDGFVMKTEDFEVQWVKKPEPVPDPFAMDSSLAKAEAPSPSLDYVKASPWYKALKNLRRARMDFGEGHYDSAQKKMVNVTDNVIYQENPPINEATGFSSETSTLPGVHKVVLDIDMEAVLIPSSRRGHYHLVIDKYMPQEKYFSFLKVMAEYGIIEKGYAEHSIRRGASWIRAPWFKKGQKVKATPFDLAPEQKVQEFK